MAQPSEPSSPLEKIPFVQAFVRVTGRVQGVGFRMFIFEQARKLGLLGWVKNCSDESVEAIYQGPKDLVEQMLEKTRQGPSLSRVQNVAISWQTVVSRFSNFSIVP